MTYCRWSSDDFRCDVYVYVSPEGWMIHVANRRPVFKEELPPPMEPGSPTDSQWWDRWMARKRIVNHLLDEAEHVTIGLPYDGKTFVEQTPGACADRLTMLAEAGYRVPDQVIADLRVEHRERGGDL